MDPVLWSNRFEIPAFSTMIGTVPSDYSFEAYIRLMNDEKMFCRFFWCSDRIHVILSESRSLLYSRSTFHKFIRGIFIAYLGFRNLGYVINDEKESHSVSLVH